ncbi:MAG: hypothetical protein WA030_00375 [Candidatus Microsaccharimonas sp.]
MLFRESEVTEARPRFTESEPVGLWSGFMPLHIPFDEFETAVSEAAATDGQRYTGFITRSENDIVTSFTRTRYPRRKYGVAPVISCQVGTNELATSLGSRLLPDAQDSGIRVVMGLIEGYAEENPSHSIDEVRAALPDALIIPAEVFALRTSATSTDVYSEPVAVISAARDQIQSIYALAERFKQERFAVENFDTGLSYMVETIHCSEPDQL